MKVFEKLIKLLNPSLLHWRTYSVAEFIVLRTRLPFCGSSDKDIRLRARGIFCFSQ